MIVPVPKKFTYWLALLLLPTFQLAAQPDPCDVNLIEISLTDITGLGNQPDYNDANVCVNGDTLAYVIATPGIACNPGALLELVEFQVDIPAEFQKGDHVRVYGSTSGGCA